MVLPTTDEALTVNTWTDIVNAINANYGVLVVKMEVLRDIDGYGRLGTTVRTNIQRKLAAIGVGTIGIELPSEGNAPVLLYRLGTPTAEVIEVIHVTEAGGNNTFDLAADTLRKLNMLPEPEKVQECISVAMDALGRVAEETRTRI